jgi:hypothetical protein
VRTCSQKEGLAVLPSEVVTARTQPNRIRRLLGDAELRVHYDAPDDPLYLVQHQGPTINSSPGPPLWLTAVLG